MEQRGGGKESTAKKVADMIISLSNGSEDNSVHCYLLHQCRTNN